jgi:hypothetical protein
MTKRENANLYDTDKVERRIKGWKNNSNSIVHKVIDKLIISGGKYSKEKLVEFIKNNCNVTNPGLTISHLKTDAGNSYGNALIERDGFILLHPDKARLINTVWKSKQ